MHELSTMDKDDECLDPLPFVVATQRRSGAIVVSYTDRIVAQRVRDGSFWISDSFCGNTVY